MIIANAPFVIAIVIAVCNPRQVSLRTTSSLTGQHASLDLQTNGLTREPDHRAGQAHFHSPR
jgi:hypothetical protein